MGQLDHFIEGTFVSDGNPHVLNIPSGFDYFLLKNLSAYAATGPATVGAGLQWEWFTGMASGDAYLLAKGAGANTVIAGAILNGDVSSYTPFNVSNNNYTGIFPVNTANQTYGSVLTATTVTSTSKTTVLGMASTAGLYVGDTVRLTDFVGGLYELGGHSFTITAITANTSITLGWLDTSGYSSVELGLVTSINVQKIFFPQYWYPYNNIITAMSSSGVNTLVTTARTTTLTVGQLVVFEVPPDAGFTQINGLRGNIIAINAATNVITVNINSSGFSPFIWPANAATGAGTGTGVGIPSLVPQMTPFGDGLPPVVITPPGQSVLDGATQNKAVNGVYLLPSPATHTGGPAGLSGDVIYWGAWKAEQTQTTFYS